MTLYIGKEGQRLGPFSVEEVQRMVSEGKVWPTDLAWHKGLPAWVPLHQIPGFVLTGPRPRVTWETPRPFLIWVIFIYELLSRIGTPFTFIVTFLISTNSSDARQAFLNPASVFGLGCNILIALAGLTGAILLVRLNRLSLYFFIGSFIAALLLIIYFGFYYHAMMPLFSIETARMVVTWIIDAAVIWYVWFLCRKGVLQ